MPTTRPQRPRPRPQVVDYQADKPESAERLMGDLADAISRIDTMPRRAFSADLSVGLNRIVHNLGRKPIGATIMPTVADAAFAWAVTDRDERTITISIIGAAQPKATIEVF